MKVRLTVVPVACAKGRGAVGLLLRDDVLTWTVMSGDVEALQQAMKCVATHFAVPLSRVREATSTGLGNLYPSILVGAGSFLAHGSLRVVYLMVHRRMRADWLRGKDQAPQIAWHSRDTITDPTDRRAAELAIETLRELLSGTPIATTLAGPYFSIKDLYDIYADLWEADLDIPNFARRWMAESANLLRPFPVHEIESGEQAPAVPTVVVTRYSNGSAELGFGRVERAGRGRPPRLYVPGTGTVFDPPLRVPATAGWRPNPLGLAALDRSTIGPT